MLFFSYNITLFEPDLTLNTTCFLNLKSIPKGIKHFKSRRSYPKGNLFWILRLMRNQICQNFHPFMQPFHYYNKIDILCNKSIAFDENMLQPIKLETSSLPLRSTCFKCCLFGRSTWYVLRTYNWAKSVLKSNWNSFNLLPVNIFESRVWKWTQGNSFQ